MSRQLPITVPFGADRGLSRPVLTVFVPPAIVLVSDYTTAQLSGAQTQPACQRASVRDSETAREAPSRAPETAAGGPERRTESRSQQSGSRQRAAGAGRDRSHAGRTAPSSLPAAPRACHGRRQEEPRATSTTQMHSAQGAASRAAAAGVAAAARAALTQTHVTAPRSQGRLSAAQHLHSNNATLRQVESIPVS